MAGTFRDFIPAAEDPGAQGSGFQDYVAPREPQIQPEVKVEEEVVEDKPLIPEVEEPAVEEKKK